MMPACRLHLCLFKSEGVALHRALILLKRAPNSVHIRRNLQTSRKVRGPFFDRLTPRRRPRGVIHAIRRGVHELSSTSVWLQAFPDKFCHEFIIIMPQANGAFVRNSTQWCKFLGQFHSPHRASSPPPSPRLSGATFKFLPKKCTPPSSLTRLSTLLPLLPLETRCLFRFALL